MIWRTEIEVIKVKASMPVSVTDIWFPIGKYFALEAGIGAGFLHADSEDYLPIDEHYVYQQSIRTNYFGPLKLKLAFVWNIGCWMERKGGGR